MNSGGHGDEPFGPTSMLNRISGSQCLEESTGEDDGRQRKVGKMVTGVEEVG